MRNKHKKSLSLPFILITVVSIGAICVLIYSLVQTTSTPVSPVRTEARSHKISTDPKFEEKEGAILPGIPLFPTYPGSILVGSSWIDTDTNNHKGFRIMWNSSDAVPTIMRWYESKFRELGWKVEVTNDPASDGEQVSNISKKPYTGYIAAEIEDGITEIVIDMRKD